MTKGKTLVSVVIPNYNYGKYLRTCLESVVHQTYDNIEVIIQDNNSTDNSFDIIREYEDKSRRGEIPCYFNVARNRRNVGSDRNCTIALGRSEGDYVIFLSSDDYLEPTFVERCVSVLDKHENVGMVMTHRKEVNDVGEIRESKPFFNCSYVAPGHEQAAVFMMAGVAVPSQVMFRRTVRDISLRYRNYQFQVAGDWYSNFLMACTADVAYIDDALCNYRVHFGNETNESEKKMLGIFEHYQLINAFCETAKSLNIESCYRRYDEAVSKLGDMCLRYALKMLKNELHECAERYLRLAIVFKPGIVEDEKYIQLCKVSSSGDEKEKMIADYDKKYCLERTQSYNPPNGYVKIDKNGD